MPTATNIFLTVLASGRTLGTTMRTGFQNKTRMLIRRDFCGRNFY
jgi:hypothetical protein